MERVTKYDNYHDWNKKDQNLNDYPKHDTRTSHQNTAIVINRWQLTQNLCRNSEQIKFKVPTFSTPSAAVSDLDLVDTSEPGNKQIKQPSDQTRWITQFCVKLQR